MSRPVLAPTTRPVFLSSRGDAAALGDAGKKSAPVRATPVVKRPKGRLFMGTLLAIACALPAYALWDTFGRYAAFGLVVGRGVQVSTPLSGQVMAIAVHDGDRVHVGELLATIGNLELEHKLERLGDDMRLAEAKLAADRANLAWQADAHSDRTTRASADYHALLAELESEEAKLEELKQNYARAKTLHEHGATPDETWDAVRFATAGQHQKVKQLRVAVEEMRTRQQAATPQAVADQLRPQEVQIETLRAEAKRLQTLLAQGQVRSPVEGIVVRRWLYPGEHAAGEQPVIEVLETNSQEIVLFVPQARLDRYAVGTQLPLTIVPHGQNTVATVARIGDRLEAAPPSVARHYSRNQRLMPVVVTIADAQASEFIKVGVEVKRPWQWADVRDWCVSWCDGWLSGGAA